MKIFLIIFCNFFVFQMSYCQGLLKSKTTMVSFFSHTTVQDIEAKTAKASAIINTATNQIAFVLPISSFVFDNPLMQEHFNEKYLESSKYPKSTFSGKILEPIDWQSDGEHAITVSGKLSIHGVEKERTILAIVKIKGSQIFANSNFMVKLDDHKIEVPTLVWEKVAEEMKVQVSAEFLGR